MTRENGAGSRPSGEDGGKERRNNMDSDRHAGEAANAGRDRIGEQDLGEMALRLAHAIRNPLATIRSAIQVVDRLQLQGEEAHRYHASVLDQVVRIDASIREMEGFVRLRPKPFETVVLREVVQQAMDVSESLAATRHSVVESVGGPELSVLANREQIVVGLGELLDNALRFGPVDSTVGLSWERLEGGEVAVHVDDRGPGIDAADAERILRPFFSTSAQGSGLGLNVACRIARLNGGRLEWSNREGGGARFTMVIRET
jgi:signal transduction histidine kinase